MKTSSQPAPSRAAVRATVAARELKALLGDDMELLNPDNATRELKALLDNDIQLTKDKKP